MPTAKKVFVDLLAVSFGDKPAMETSELCNNHVLYLNKTYMIASSCCYSGNRFNQCWRLGKNLQINVRKEGRPTISESNRADSLLAAYGIAPITSSVTSQPE